MDKVEYQASLFVDEVKAESLFKIVAQVGAALEATKGISLTNTEITPQQNIQIQSNIQFDLLLATASSESGLTLAISKNKIGIIQVRPEGANIISQSEFLEIVRTIISTDSLKSHNFTRYGFAKTVLLPVNKDEDYSKYSKAILAPQWSKDISAASMRLVYKISNGEDTLNLNLTIESVKVLGSDQKAMRVQSDINTLESVDMSKSGLQPIDVLNSLAIDDYTKPYIQLLTAVKIDDD